MATQAGFDPNAFGPFGALFQNYFSALESFSQGRSPFGGGLPGFDPQALSAQATAPLKVAARCQLEVMGLANRRTQAYLQVPTRLAQCRTPQDFLNEQMAFWHTAMEQYGESSRKVADAWAHLMPASFGSAGAARAERDYISFNNGSGKDHGAAAKQDPASKQRRVA